MTRVELLEMLEQVKALPVVETVAIRHDRCRCGRFVSPVGSYGAALVECKKCGLVESHFTHQAQKILQSLACPQEAGQVP